MKKILQTPLSNKDIENLRTGDIVYLTGLVATARDSAHRRLVERKNEPDFDLNGMALLHAGPIVRKQDDGWEMISVGPTTSMRMETFEADCIRERGIKLIVGKGGMGEKTAAACKEYKALHTVFPGGCAVLAAEQVEKIEGVKWLDLGIPEAFWVLRVKEFGPLIVTIDTQGNNLFESNQKILKQRRDEIIKEVLKKVDYMK